MTQAIPYQIAIADERVDQVRSRLIDAVWPDMSANPPGCDGMDQSIVRTFVDHVTDRDFDWRAMETELNRAPHFIVDIDGLPIHFLHYRGSGSPARPLLLLHGWPGGFIEFLDVAERLAHPERFGGDIKDSWSVIIPSLPGFGLSAAPPRPRGPRYMAHIIDRLMREILGYESYVAQGGDWGATIAAWLGHEHPACRAIHLNFHVGWGAAATATDVTNEQAALDRLRRFMAEDGAYIAIQGTKPVTLAYAMGDSPLGAAAWLLEKFDAWSDPAGGSLWDRFRQDRLTAHIMLYLLTGCFGTASWIYRGAHQPDEARPESARVEKPVGIACYPAEIAAFPKAMVSRLYNIVHWAEPAHGGHFAAFEKPALFADDITRFGRLIDRNRRNTGDEYDPAQR